MNIVICWTQMSGYMAACWRELAGLPGIRLHVLCYRDAEPSSVTAFDMSLLEGIEHTFLDDAQRHDGTLISRLVTESQPDAVMIAGWVNHAYRKLAFDSKLAKARFLFAMDTPFRGDLRQRLARWKLGPFLNRMDWVVVSGELTRTYARILGVPESRIQKGVYAYDQRLFNESLFEQRKRLPGGWPRRFLYVGRYAPEKAIDVLIAGYKRYRGLSENPWPLECYGMGPSSALLDRQAGVTNHGFVQPADQPRIFINHGAFVLASRYEPWGVVVSEAMAAGLPVICSSACGAATSLLHSQFNGIEVAADDPDSLAQAFLWMDRHHSELDVMGRQGMAVARAYSAEMWARRVSCMCVNASTR